MFSSKLSGKLPYASRHWESCFASARFAAPSAVVPDLPGRLRLPALPRTVRSRPPHISVAKPMDFIAFPHALRIFMATILLRLGIAIYRHCTLLLRLSHNQITVPA